MVVNSKELVGMVGNDGEWLNIYGNGWGMVANDRE